MAFLKEKRTAHWSGFEPAIDGDNFAYHLAGADYDLARGISPEHTVHYQYRFWYEDALLAALIKRHVQTPTRALDVGCGTGRGSVVLAHHFEAVDAFDLSDIFIKTNQTRWTLPNVTFSVSDVTSFEYQKEHYDAVFIGGVLMCLDATEVQTCLESIARSLTPGGVVIVRDTISKQETKVVDEAKIIRSYEDECTLFENAGLTIAATCNSANRSLPISFFNRLPQALQSIPIVQNGTVSLAKAWGRNEIAHVGNSQFSRHPLANQIYFVCTV